MSWIPGWDSIVGAGWWSGFYFWLSICALIGLGIFEVASHRYSDRKDELAATEQEAVQRRHDEDMARVQHDTAEANERAAQLEKDAESARASIAEANARAARANQSAARVLAAAIWRYISPHKSARLQETLRLGGGSAQILYPANDPEAVGFASQIDNLFRRADKWNVKFEPFQYSRRVYFGLHIFGQNNEVVELARQAFSAADISYSTDGVDPLSSTLPDDLLLGTPERPSEPPPDVIIFVGSKSPPRG